jgi:3-phenylpropionate/trans-cinnamate dioxygenase ferredoxin component
VRVASLQELSDSGKICLEVDDRFVVLVRLGNDLFCLDDVCTHDGGTLGEGPLIDDCLVCPRHGARFNVRTGEAVVMPATEATAVHEVHLDGDEIYVRLNG